MQIKSKSNGKLVIVPPYTTLFYENGSHPVPEAIYFSDEKLGIILEYIDHHEWETVYILIEETIYIYEDQKEKFRIKILED